MPFFISAKTFKHQAKVLVKYWPFKTLKTTEARQLLSQLYGYKDNHHYRKILAQPSVALIPLSEEVLLTHYKPWVKKLADLGSINQTQAKAILHKLWPAYLDEKAPLSDKLYSAKFRFHGECNDFLSAEKASVPIDYAFDDRPSVKDAIEALGVPHTEVGAIKVDDHWVEFKHLMMDGQQVEVFPNPYSQTPYPLPYKPQGVPSFLLDVHLAALARYLRLAGFDCLHEGKDYGDAVLAEVAATDEHILLTRDIGLLKRSKVKYGRWIRNTSPEYQFKEVVDHYRLHDFFKPLSRCVRCNGAIEAVDIEEVRDRVPERVLEWQTDFKQCARCSQVYWKGSHFEKIMQILQKGQGQGS
ncbi:Mut7-C RNAse domain-containing protein [Chitinimonas lacunae]|uniref:Mut7-C RNAse domain-containing protein n=1 Tax=Chitinimonas lacunae TaxID=1963018 RepID=A0ABV8MPU7_9NEIS